MSAYSTTDSFCVLTSSAKGDHDVSGAAVDSCERERSDIGPNLQSFRYGVINLCHRHVRGVVHYPAGQKTKNKEDIRHTAVTLSNSFTL